MNDVIGIIGYKVGDKIKEMFHSQGVYVIWKQKNVPLYLFILKEGFIRWSLTFMV